MSTEGFREKLQALLGVAVCDADVVKLLIETIACGGGVSLDLDDGHWKLIRREGRFVLKKDEARTRASTMPPRPGPVR